MYPYVSRKQRSVSSSPFLKAFTYSSSDLCIQQYACINVWRFASERFKVGRVHGNTWCRAKSAWRLFSCRRSFFLCFVLEVDWDVRCVSTGRETKNHTFLIARNREIAFSDLTTQVLCKIIKRRDSVEVTCKITVFGRVKWWLPKNVPISPTGYPDDPKYHITPPEFRLLDFIFSISLYNTNQSYVLPSHILFLPLTSFVADGLCIS